MATTTRLSRAEAAVLSALAPGGILSVDSVARSAGLTGQEARGAVLRLQSVGLIFHGGMPSRSGYQITDRGRNALTTDGRYS